MESDVDDLEAFSSELYSEDLGIALAGAGIPPFPASPTASADTSVTATAAHVGGGAAPDVPPDVNGTFAAMRLAESEERPLQGDMCAVTILVVLVTALCRCEYHQRALAFGMIQLYFRVFTACP